MSPLVIMLQFAVLAYALVAGVFLAFSDFIMRSLALTGGVGGVEAMQVINREVFRWVFMTLFLGMAAGSVALAAMRGSVSGPAAHADRGRRWSISSAASASRSSSTCR
jgi:uncharacterized membrane protein